jgi:Protein of unknown function (DUF2971)
VLTGLQRNRISDGIGMVTQDEFKAYTEFCTNQFQVLGTPYVNPQEPLWHYTNGSALVEILRSGRLWSTQVSCLNDMTEVNYGSQMLGDALRSILPSLTNDAILETFTNFYLSRLSTGESNSDHQAVSRHYVACFSKIPDSLSQWRAYSGGENGFAIGFSAPEIVANYLLCSVSYDKSKQAAVADAVARATIKFFSAGLVARPGIKPSEWAASFLPVWDSHITYLAAVGKHPSFEEEEEVRIVVDGPTDPISLEFRQKSSILSRHYPLAFPNKSREGKEFLPIVEVTVGPSRYKGVSMASVQALLRKYGYGPEVNVSVSKCPFQAL